MRNVVNRTIKQYENDKGIVMFIDDRKTFQTVVSYCTISGEKINNDDDRALTFFLNGPCLISESQEEEY